jgi:hypothetical protein
MWWWGGLGMRNFVYTELAIIGRTSIYRRKVYIYTSRSIYVWPSRTKPGTHSRYYLTQVEIWPWSEGDGDIPVALMITNASCRGEIGFTHSG